MAAGTVHGNGTVTSTKEKDADLFSAIGKQVLGVADQKDGEDDGANVKVVEEIESLCMECEEDGITRLLLTKIPFFREVILMSFFCEHCGFRNNEIQPAGEIQEKGSKFLFSATAMEDLQRQVVKSDTATLRVEEVDIEIPPGKGRLTNVEGVLLELITGLNTGQKERKREDKELYEKIDAVIKLLLGMAEGTGLPFTLTMDDPAGNSSVEPSPQDAAKKKYMHEQYERTPEQNAALGLGEGGEQDGDADDEADRKSKGAGMEDVEILEGATYDLPIDCPGCTKPAHMLLQMVNIPHFKQVVLSTTQCDHCNYHSSDAKSGGEVPERGKRIWLNVKEPADVQRDILKSDTAMLKIPECKIEVVPGTMGGRFTTVEGLLTQVRDDLRASIFDTDPEDPDSEEGQTLDSMEPEKKKAWGDFFALLEQAIKGEMEYTLLLEDPLANSFCQAREDLGGEGKDPQVEIEEYDRTAEEEERLGLDDMRTHLNEDGEYVKEPVEVIGTI